MDCVPTCTVGLEMESIPETHPTPAILYVALFGVVCAEASDGRLKTPEAKIRTKSKARARNPENSENVLD